jgi:hypothetical protein
VDVLVALLIALALAGAVAFVSAPLRRRADEGAPETGSAQGLAALEAAKEAKYREIRDTELDYRTGKLSEEDFRVLDATLRSEAAAILARARELEARG